MIVEAYTPEGQIDRTPVHWTDADTAYNDLKHHAEIPGCCYYRIVLRDGDRIARDTDQEVFGRSTMQPGQIVYTGKKGATGMALYWHSNGYATGFGTKGE